MNIVNMEYDSMDRLGWDDNRQWQTSSITLLIIKCKESIENTLKESLELSPIVLLPITIALDYLTCINVKESIIIRISLFSFLSDQVYCTSDLQY